MEIRSLNSFCSSMCPGECSGEGPFVSPDAVPWGVDSYDACTHTQVQRRLTSTHTLPEVYLIFCIVLLCSTQLREMQSLPIHDLWTEEKRQAVRS